MKSIFKQHCTASMSLAVFKDKNFNLNYFLFTSAEYHQGGRQLSTPNLGNPTSRLKGMLLKSSLDSTQEADEDDEEGEIITSAPLTTMGAYQPNSSGEASTSHQDEVEDSRL